MYTADVCCLNSGPIITSQASSQHAGVHFIMIGAYELQPQPAPYTSTNMLISATQIAWINADLAAVDRTVTPWIVAMFHPREPQCSPHTLVIQDTSTDAVAHLV